MENRDMVVEEFMIATIIKIWGRSVDITMAVQIKEMVV